MDEMKDSTLVIRVPRRTALAVACGLIGLVAGVMVARATAGGATKSALGFSGTLLLNGAPANGPQMLTYTFKKNGGVTCAPQVQVTPDPQSGAFTTEVPLSSCPTFFDGSDVTVDVTVGNTIVATAQPVDPVPYAKYADVAASVTNPVSALCHLVDTGSGTDLGAYLGEDFTWDATAKVALSRTRQYNLYYLNGNCSGTPYALGPYDQQHLLFQSVRYISTKNTRFRITGPGASLMFMSIVPVGGGCVNGTYNLFGYPVVDEGGNETLYDPMALKIVCGN
jgi:hypothetical protein